MHRTQSIVFITGRDPVELGFVASLNRPGGNLTGVSLLNDELVPKRLELLRELVPRAATIAILLNPDNRNHPSYAVALDSVARAGGQRVLVLGARIDPSSSRLLPHLSGGARTPSSSAPIRSSTAGASRL